jgi:hypothetical protein
VLSGGTSETEPDERRLTDAETTSDDDLRGDREQAVGL